MKIIIIGGVAAGMSAASKIKRTAYDAQVIVYEKGDILSYGACGLPYFVGDDIKDPGKMIARSKESFEEMGIEIHTRHEIVAVDDMGKTVQVKNLMTGELFQESYDKLLVASGASPVLPPWPGIELQNVFSLNTIEDGIRIKEAAQSKEVQSVAIIGAGFIGVELAEAMLNLGKQVTLIEFRNQILPLFDKELVQSLQKELTSHGVQLRLGEKVVEIQGNGRVHKVVTQQNQYPADLVIVSVGVRPNTGFLKGTAVRLERNGAMLVDKEMRSSVPDIFGAGDCATVYHRVLDTMNAYIPLGTNANKQGKIAGSILCGKKLKFDGGLGTAMVKVCGMEAAKTGITEQEAIMNHFDCKTITVTAYNHASYYPDPKPMQIKLVYETTHKTLLGAQLVGYDSTAIRVDVFALAIHNQMTTEELGMVDFGYAPPFASVWDAVAVACNAVK